MMRPFAIVQDFLDTAAAVVFVRGYTVQSTTALTWHWFNLFYVMDCNLIYRLNLSSLLPKLLVAISQSLNQA